MRFPAFVVVAVIAVAGPVPRLAAQAITPPSVDTIARPTANPADVASVDAILTSLYDVISGPAGQARNWDRFRSLLVPNARLMPTGLRQGGGASVAVLSAEDYVRRAGPGLERN